MGYYTGYGQGGYGYQTMEIPPGGGSFYDNNYGSGNVKVNADYPQPGDPNFIGPIQPNPEKVSTLSWKDVGLKFLESATSVIVAKQAGKQKDKEEQYRVQVLKEKAQNNQNTESQSYPFFPSFTTENGRINVSMIAMIGVVFVGLILILKVK